MNKLTIYIPSYNCSDSLLQQLAINKEDINVVVNYNCSTFLVSFYCFIDFYKNTLNRNTKNKILKFFKIGF